MQSSPRLRGMQTWGRTLVVRTPSGEVQSVKYEELILMLLNQAQHQERAVSELRTQNADLAARLERLEQVSAQATTLASH